jgi:hypothetical protein
MNLPLYFSHLLSDWPESQYKDQQMMLLSLCDFLENHCSKGYTFLVCDTPLHWFVVCWLLSLTHSNIGLFVCQLLSYDFLTSCLTLNELSPVFEYAGIKLHIEHVNKYALFV